MLRETIISTEDSKEDVESELALTTVDVPHVEDDMEQATAKNDNEDGSEDNSEIDDEAEMNEYFERMDRAFAARQEIKRQLVSANNRKTASQQNRRKKKRRK